VGSGDEAKTITPTELTFTTEQPSVFYPHEGGTPFRGQAHAKKLIDVKIHAVSYTTRFKALFTGPAGTGKTTLAWITARRIQERHADLGLRLGRFFEILPAQIGSKAELDDFMRQLMPRDIVFVDEVHILKSNVGAEPLYHTLADTGPPRYPLGKGEGWIDVDPTISWIAATTEPGELDDTTGGALRRRLSPEIRLDPPGLDVLAKIIEDQEFPVSDGVAQTIAQRSGGLPWQVLLLYHTARDFAIYGNKTSVDMQSAEEAFSAVGVDEYGLFEEDRRVIQVLLDSPYRLANGEIRYKMSELALCASAGIDKNTYKQLVQPRLMRQGFLTTVGGQSLTQKALETFR